MNPHYGSLHAELAGALRFLPDKPEETADSTLRALWHAAAGVPLSAARAAAAELPQLDNAALDTLRSLVRRRVAGEPLAHITGRQQFMGLEMLAGPDALLPRRETELLGRAVVELAWRLAAERQPITVVDVCTGAGNLALAIAISTAGARVIGADLSAPAVELARRNALHLGCAQRATFRVGDLLEPLDSGEFVGKVDLLTCNPPYISSARVSQMPAEIAAHEPRLAFDGGPFGVSVLLRLVQQAPRFLRPGGWLAFEVGLGQGPAMLKRLETAGPWREIRSVTDGRGAIRALLAGL